MNSSVITFLNFEYLVELRLNTAYALGVGTRLIQVDCNWNFNGPIEEPSFNALAVLVMSS